MFNAMDLFPYTVSAGIGIVVGIILLFISTALEKKMTERREIPYRETGNNGVLILMLCILCGFFAVRYGTGMRTLFLMVSLFALFTLSVTDAKYRIIPNSMVLTLILARLLLDFGSFREPGVLKDALFGAGFGLVAFMAPSLTGAHIGYGDVKLAAASGFAFGLSIFLPSVCIMGLILLADTLVFSRIGTAGAMTFSAALKRKVPLGPALSAALTVMLIINGFVPVKEVIGL